MNTARNMALRRGRAGLYRAYAVWMFSEVDDASRACRQFESQGSLERQTRPTKPSRSRVDAYRLRDLVRQRLK